MVALAGTSNRTFDPLPIDSSRGFPQSFPLLFANRNYRFRLYVNVPAAQIEDKAKVLDLPSADAFLVVSVELDLPDGTSQPIFLRKVVPGLEYESEDIALVFPQQRVAVQNLNNSGEFGSQVTGGIAPRWA
jgi:hypothetical protein